MERLGYFVDVDADDRTSVVAVVDALVDVVEEAVEIGWIDAYSDYRRSLPPAIAEAQDLLRARGAARGPGDDPGMGIQVDPADAEGWRLLRAYGPWSIHMELELKGANHPTATCHDCGLSITADLTAAEAANLAERLSAGVATLERLPGPVAGRRRGGRPRTQNRRDRTR